MTDQTAQPAGAFSPGRVKTLRRIASEAQNTYVERNWPSMEAMRKDGIGHGLVEDSAHERLIRRYLDTFQPEFVVDLLDRFATLDAARAASPSDGLREALEQIVSYEPEFFEGGPLNNADCADCQAASARQWPPSGLCDTHYHVLSQRDQVNRDRQNHSGYAMKAIARAALEATGEGSGMMSEIDVKLLRHWQDELRYIDRTLERAATSPTDGHIPIWAREDRVTIKRICNQIDALTSQSGS